PPISDCRQAVSCPRNSSVPARSFRSDYRSLGVSASRHLPDKELGSDAGYRDWFAHLSASRATADEEAPQAEADCCRADLQQASGRTGPLPAFPTADPV